MDSFDDYVDVYIGSQRLSIQSYLNKVISNRAYGDDTILLAKAMKNYCAAAAYHFEVAENYAVVEGMGPYLNEVTVDILEQFKPSKGEAYSVAPLNFKMATVVLESETSIRVYFSLADGYTVTTDADGNIWLSGEYNGQQVTVPITATLKGSDTEVSLKLKQSGVESRPYCLEISGICAKDYFTMYSIKIMDTEYISYSVAGYARTVLSNPNKYSEDVVDVVKAMMVYGYAANEYFNNSQGE